MKRWLAVIVVAACSHPKSHPPPQPDRSPCPRVADHLVSLMSGATKHPPEATDPLRRVIGERCEQDRWSEPTTSCLLALTSLADGARCQATMSQAQIDAFQRDTEAAATQLRGQLVEPPPDAAMPDAP